MAKKKTTAAAIDAAVVETDAADLLIGQELAIAAVESEEAEAPPGRLTPEWNEYVKTFFLGDEVDMDGNPTHDGLRRVSQMLVGEIISEIPRVVQAPTDANGRSACVEVVVTYATPSGIRTFGDAADVYPGNTMPTYAVHAVASAITKATSRAFRKALGLRKVYSAEEMATPPLGDAGLDGMITESQIKSLNKTCRDLDIDVLKFINKGKNQYKHHTLIRCDTARKMLEALNNYLRDPSTIEDEIRGYDMNWKKAE